MVLRIYYYTNSPNLDCNRQKTGQCTPEIVGAHRYTGRFSLAHRISLRKVPYSADGPVCVYLCFVVPSSAFITRGGTRRKEKSRATSPTKSSTWQKIKGSVYKNIDTSQPSIVACSDHCLASSSNCLASRIAYIWGNTLQLEPFLFICLYYNGQLFAV